mgnify:CR=1 FL=1
MNHSHHFKNLLKNPEKKTAQALEAHTAEIRRTSQESDLHKRIKDQFSAIFDEFNDLKERMVAILKRIEPFFQHIDKKILPNEKISEIKLALQACEDTSDKQQFLSEIMIALKPALDIREAHADKFEEVQARTMNESEGFIEINRLLSYGKSGPTIHIHAPASKIVGNKITLYREGLKKLAEIINDDPTIKKVSHFATRCHASRTF